MKAKVCKNKHCKKTFVPEKFAQVACDYHCAIEYGRQKKEKKILEGLKFERKIQKEKKEKCKPITYFATKAQTAFNAWIRESQKDNGCISCGIKINVQFCAGHFYTRKARPWLRFNEDNVHLQCNQFCNLHNSGNIIWYRPRLIEKIGQERFDAMTNLTGRDWKPTKDFYLDVEKKYKLKLKELKWPMAQI
jgi:hypothetical protein